MIQPIPKESILVETVLIYLKVTTTSEKKVLIHANFYTLPPNGAERLGKDTQPWLRGLIQPVLEAASCDDHPLLIPARFCPAVCHILHSPLLQDQTLRRAAQPSRSSCSATVS